MIKNGQFLIYKKNIANKKQIIKLFLLLLLA